nr:sigma-70 family RNA polymerase sigma factor [uncultured Blautia sp.]
MQKRKITIKSGREEIQMEVTEEEYQRFYRPWWQQKKKEQRNREAMEAKGYRMESYEEWKENDMRTELFSDSLEEMMEKKAMLEVLKEALDNLMPEERELAEKVLGGEMQVSEYAKLKMESRTTVSSRKKRLLDKLRRYFVEQGFDV